MSKSNEGQHRTINVTGNGNFKEKPDYTEVDFSLDTKSKDYEKAQMVYQSGGSPHFGIPFEFYFVYQDYFS